jgi:phosphatidylglycerol lysyltransferase
VARDAGKRVSCFATESRFLDAVGWPALRIGEQPTWEPAQWSAQAGARGGLRAQLRRARAKGVTIRKLAPDELHAPRAATRAAVDALGARWLASHPLAPMSFLVRPDLDAFPAERLYFVAEHDGRLVGFLGAVPVYARSGWLLEDLWREADAPNGTAELLIDAGMNAAADGCAPYATLGLVPLAGALPLWLRLARRAGRPLYDFEGLRAFRARLGPARWDPIYLAHPRSSVRALAVLDALEAFAGGGLLRFGVRTLLRRGAWTVRGIPG